MKVTAINQVNQSYNKNNCRKNYSSKINFSSNYYSRETLDLITEKATDWWCKKLINADKKAIVIFAKALKKNLEKTINDFGREDYLSECVKLCEVDYIPDEPLYYALKKAKMSPSNSLPIKTSMYLMHGKIEVTEGSQSTYKEIYQLPAGLNKLFDIPPESSSPNLFQRIFGSFK